MKNVKGLVLSAVGALAFASIAVGTTFALFTSKDETTIQVNSGKVDVSSVASIVNVYELNNNQPLVPSEQGVYTNSIGGTTSIENNVVTLNNWAPGDKVVIDLQNLNKSTVKVLTRLAIYHNSVPGKGDLYPALDITIRRAGETNPIDPVKLFKWTNRDVPENPVSGESFDQLEITIEFPDHDNGEIIFDSSNSDNQYQNCACVISLGLEAVQGNAYISPVTTINDYARYVGDVITMSDAVEVADKLEYTLTDFEGYVWDSKNYQFVSESSVEENFNQYFKAYDGMPSDPTFSIYANATSWDASVSLDGVGFDAGSANGITSINYVNTSGVAKTNIIRTNSGTLTIDAGSDIVHHYGYADSLDIIAVAGTSYHEFGEVGYANIANGRLVIEENSNIGGIFLVANNQGEFDDIKLAVVGGATLPTLARADVSLEAGESKLVVEVQTLESSESEDPNPEFIWISNNGSAVKTVVSSSSNPEDYPSHIIDEPTAAGEAAKKECEESAEPIDENSVARINAVGYLSLSEAFADIKDGDTVTMLKDFTVTSGQGILVNNDVALDLNGKTISGNNDPLFVLGSTVVSYQSPASSYTHKGHLIVTGDGTIINTNWDTFKIYPDAVLDIYNGTFSANKIALNATGGTINTYGGDFSCYGTGSSSQLVQLGGGAVGNFVAGNFHTPNNGCYGVYISTDSVANFGKLGEEGPTFDTWRSCITTNGDKSLTVTINIYSGTFKANRNDVKIDDQNVIQLANTATNEKQTLNIYGGYFEQTSHLENSCIFTVRYDEIIELNLKGGTFNYGNNSKLFCGYGTDGSGYPSASNIIVDVENDVIPKNVTIEVYGSGVVRIPERDFVVNQ